MQNFESMNILSDSDDEQQILQNSEPLMSMEDTTIVDIYSHNFKQELKKMAKLATTFNIIAMDTQFPGYTVRMPDGYLGKDEIETQNYEYQFIKKNVNVSKIIQLGLTLSDEHGRVPQGVCTWQFNFHFNTAKDVYNSASKDLLEEAGIDFNKHKQKGIDINEFAQYWISSGIVFNKKIKWIVFHGSSDFAYLLKIVHGNGLPDSFIDFYRLIKIYYPNICDIKYFIKDLPILKHVKLSKLGDQFGCFRIGPQHQAGSDSLLTLRCYFKLKQRQHVLKNPSYMNIIYGIGEGFIKNSKTSSHQTYPNYGGPAQTPNYMQPIPSYYYDPNYGQDMYFYYPYQYN